MAKYAMTPNQTSSFEKIGDAGYQQVLNMSGDRSPYTMPQARKGPTSPDLGGQNKSNRSASMIHEAHGPTFAPVASRSYGSEYPETGRAVYTVPSRTGLGDFWNQRQDGRSIG